MTHDEAIKHFIATMEHVCSIGELERIEIWREYGETTLRRTFGTALLTRECEVIKSIVKDKLAL